MLYFLEDVFPFKEGHGIYSFKKKKLKLAQVVIIN